jgi:hypothetical protein
MASVDEQYEHLPDDLRYEDWVTYVFDHPVTRPQWWFCDLDDELPDWNPLARPARTLEYLTRLFREPSGLIGRFSRAQIDQGLNLIVSSACSNHMFVLMDTTLPLQDRCACIDAMRVLYRDLMAPVYGDDTECGERTDDEPERPNFSCFMWWEAIPLSGGMDHPDRDALNDAVLKVFEATLTLKSEACLESVLHGLGHWHSDMPERVSAIVRRFLAERTDISPELRAYSEDAAEGMVL